MNCPTSGYFGDFAYVPTSLDWASWSFGSSGASPTGPAHEYDTIYCNCDPIYF